MIQRRLLVTMLVTLAAGPAALAQDAPPTGQGLETAPEAELETGDVDEIFEDEEAILAGVAGSSYDPEGRRDPFRSLLERTTVDADRPRPPGVPGLLIDEIDLKGLFYKSGEWVALVETADKDKSYLLREGDELFDGDVVSINLEHVVFNQIVNDPKIFKPFREVVKKLNPGT